LPESRGSPDTGFAFATSWPHAIWAASPLRRLQQRSTNLTLGEVYAALAYYEDHREEIDQAGCDEDRTIEEFRRRHPQLVHNLRPSEDDPC